MFGGFSKSTVKHGVGGICLMFMSAIYRFLLGGRVSLSALSNSLIKVFNLICQVGWRCILALCR